MNGKRQYPWGTGKRFNSFADYVRLKYGGRVQKLTIDAGFTCPNRDGKKGRGGCSYCNNDAFNPSYCMPEKSVLQQIEEGISFHKKRYNKAVAYLAYFQAYSNTYGEVEKLRSLYEQALGHKDVAGLVIGTRPDCTGSEVMDLLAEINGKTDLTVEYGIESCYNRTLKRINRGHDFETTVKAIEETHARGIRTGGHMILGLPGESREEILAQAEILSGLPIDQLKFHQLQIVRDTLMGKDYIKNPAAYPDFSLEEYLALVAGFTERLRPGIVIERIAGETVPEYNLRPSWGIRYDRVLELFVELLEKRDSWQGKYYDSNREADE